MIFSSPLPPWHTVTESSPITFATSLEYPVSPYAVPSGEGERTAGVAAPVELEAMSDIPNYADIMPAIQISEVVS